MKRIAKKFSAFLLIAVCMLLFAPQAFADGDGGQAYPETYEELLTAIAAGKSIHITPILQWPEEPVTLDLRAAACSIFAGTVIPENVTVNAYQYCGINANGSDRSAVVINGNWNCCADNAMPMGNPDPQWGVDVVYNGTVTVQEGVWNTTTSGICVTINGRLINYGARCRLENAVFGDGAYIGGTQEVSFNNTLSVPTGKLTVDVPLRASCGNQEDDPTLSGRFELAELRTDGSSTCTIAEGAHVIAANFNSPSGSKWLVDGTLELKDGARFNSFGGQLTLGDTGVLALRTDSWFNGSGSIDGTGTVRLYALVRNNVPHTVLQLFGATYYPDADTSDQVADTVTVWKNWENTCEHEWETVSTFEANCAQPAGKEQECTLCGERQFEYTGKETNPDNHKSIVYTRGKSWLNQRCEGCGNHATATLTATDAVYKGSPVETATVTVDDNWIGAGPTLTCSNNNAPGTATATITAGGASYKVEFTIYAQCPGHQGSSDDCTEAAECTLCGETFGGNTDHSFASQYSCDDTGHWYACTNDGCTVRGSEADHALSGGTKCATCGYEVFTVNLSTEDGTVTASLSVANVSAGQRLLAAVYDQNGRFLGCGQATFDQSQENAALTVTVPTGGDLLTLFRVEGDWHAAQEAASTALK